MAFEVSFQYLAPGSSSACVESLAEMAQFTFADTFRHYREEDLQSYLAGELSPEAIRRELEDGSNRFYFVLLDGVRAGYLKWTFPTQKYLNYVTLPARRPFLIERFYFLPEYCGRGLASIALAFIISYARHEAGADYIYLSVWARNYRAQRFYQKHGFRTLGSFDYPVGDEVDHELLYGMPLEVLAAKTPPQKR